MNLYQRYLSKSLIFIFSLFFLILFFLESSIGFKWFFNFTNYFFIGLKTEEISGNWRNFTLKKISFNILETSIKASSITIIIDPISLFKFSTVLKKIETKNLIISLNNTEKIVLKNNFLKEKKIKNTLFFKHSLILRKIYSDKILLKIQKKNIFLFGIFSGLKLSNNTLTLFPTKINSIHIDSSIHNIKNISDKKSNFFIRKDIFCRKKIDSFLSFFSNYKNFFIPIDINIINLNCNQLKYFNKKILDIYRIKVNAQLKKNILKIKNIQIYSKFFKIKSQGKIFFRNNFPIFFIVKNKISTNIYNNKVMNILFKGTISNKFTFNLKSTNLFKFKINGDISLDDLNYPIDINLHFDHLFFTISKKLVLSSKNFNLVLKGQINNYLVSLKNIVNISGIPSFFINISAVGNLKHIVLKKINFFPFFQKIKSKRFIKLKKETDYNQYISELVGKISILCDLDKQSNNIFFPNFHFQGDVMKKKISVLGSLYYQKLNGIKIPRINFLLGKNKGYISGSISKKINIHSSIHAHSLNYFLPNLKGVIKATLNLYGLCSVPSISSVILGERINWKNILNLNSIKILTNVNFKKTFSKNFYADIKKIRFSKFYINSLNIQANWNNINQKFSLSLKNKKLSIKLILNGYFDKKIGIWKGFLKKIDIKTPWGQWIIKNCPLMSYYTKNSINFHNITKTKNVFYSVIHNIQNSLFKLMQQSSIKLQTDLFFNTKFKWKFGENISSLKLSLKGNNIKIEKKIKERILIEKINSLNLYVNFKKNNFITKWMIKKSRNPLKINEISGFLNIYDFFHKKKIEGKFFLSDFSCSFLNFFTNFFTNIQGKFSGNINFLGTVYQPQISADINFQDVYIKSDNIFKYILLFFYSFPKNIENIKINQEIIMKKGNILFRLNSVIKNSISNFKWNIFFNSNKIEIVLVPKIKLNFSSKLSLYYFLSKYDLIGYLKFSFFSFKINEKNFLF
ncbi:translocation/assembly module TamB [Buchnera aphidicola (Rhopalosiphum padi)]|uniref:Translocation/assembly module TamB n=1 Tax=Buchnera aphidicola subsp. Rhopalosiphum padi TaxID=98793 RepID=A0A4D6YFQ5_BUCRP|nr:translocation/assembly module TamB [Buchnera aphidicola]QCI24744.1 translocation/assembly module TamB [Buchnera aphidicola (Rhopalosiphum padi)]